MVCLFVGLLSKSKGLILRMTGCLHCLFQLDSFNDAFSWGESDFEPSTVVTDSAVKAAVNFVATCINHTLYLCGRNSSAEEVRMLHRMTLLERRHRRQRMNLPSQWLILEDTYFFCLARDCTSQPWMKKRNLGTWGISKGQWTRSPVSNRMDSESLFQRRHREPQRLVATNPFWIYHTNTRVSEHIFFPIFPSTGVLFIIDVTIIIPWHLFPSLFFVRSNTHSSRLT